MYGKAAKKRNRTPKAKAVYNERKNTTGCVRSVDRCRDLRHHYLGDEHMHWPKKARDNGSLHCSCSSTSCGLCFQPKLLRATGQYYRLVSFFHRKRCNVDGQRDEDHTPLRPAPAFVLRCESADHRSRSLALILRDGIRLTLEKVLQRGPSRTRTLSSRAGAVGTSLHCCQHPRLALDCRLVQRRSDKQSSWRMSC